MHIFLIVTAVWTVLWIVAQVALARSEYATHITLLARLLLYVFPLFIVYNVIRHMVGGKTESEKLAGELSGKV